MSRLNNSTNKNNSNSNLWLCCYSTTANHHRRGGTIDDSNDTITIKVDDDNSTVLNVISCLLAVVSLVIIVTAVTTGHWLLTEEKLAKLPQTGIQRAKINNNNATSNNYGEIEPEVKFTYSGLWKVCFAHGEFFFSFFFLIKLKSEDL